MLIKISILLLYKRTFIIKPMRNAIYAVGAFVIGNAISNITSFALLCTPLARFWDPERPGHCTNRPLLFMFASLFPMLTDVAIYVMPMPVIWRLQMTLRRKFELTLVFAVGGFVCLTGIVRLIETIIIETEDFTYTLVRPALWNMVESEIGFVAGNMLSMGPLFGKIRTHVPKIRSHHVKRKAVSDASWSTRPALGRRYSIGGSELRSDNTTVKGSPMVSAGSRVHYDDSAEEALWMDSIDVKASLQLG
ncbi:hypothetical protein MMC07_002173 [Pseudocyphellaria aurata]|nr:hypothetical protein [Pseudocyphellaria aurata]